MFIFIEIQKVCQLLQVGVASRSRFVAELPFTQQNRIEYVSLYNAA